MVEEATIPGLQALWSPTKIGMWTENRVHGIEFFGESAAFTFYCDTDWDVRAYFEDWMQTVVNPQTKEPRFYDETIGRGEVDVIALDKQEDRAKRWTLKEAFPRLLNITPVAQGGDGIVRVAVTFSYRSWEASSTGPGTFGNFVRDLRKGKGVGEAIGDLIRKDVGRKI
ncbi:MAG: hypothetical protein VXX39_05565 [Candidatus Thermoplasmatota archaeon]|nr:hypothetical protein [Candidatus Thermoplasmatota archaeon]